MVRLWRYVWPLPWTVAGLLAALLAGLLGARWQHQLGTLEVHGGLLAAVCRRLPASLRFEAITLGHVVLGLDTACLDGARAHEQVHVRQYERWGPLFVPLYLASSGWQWLRGGCPIATTISSARPMRWRRSAISLRRLMTGRWWNNPRIANQGTSHGSEHAATH